MKKRFKMTIRSLVLSAAALFMGVTAALASAPAAPTLHSPTNGSNVGGNQITFKWILDPNAAYYFPTFNLEVQHREKKLFRMVF